MQTAVQYIKHASHSFVKLSVLCSLGICCFLC